MRAYVFVLLSLSLEIQNYIAITVDTNLALNRVATYCDDPTPLKWVTDGDRNLSEKITKTCAEYSYVEVDLGEKHLVYYVIVYKGINESNGINEGLHRFMVENVDYEGKSIKCGSYNMERSDDNKRKIPNGRNKNKGMRVNCLVGNYSKVRMKSNKKGGFSIAEIEVYTIDFTGIINNIAINSAAKTKCPINHCKHEMNTECVSTEASFECACVRGFQHNENGSCVDLDECFSMPCDLTSSTCQNEIGFYTCQCKPGFFSTGTEFCIRNTSEARDIIGIVGSNKIMYGLIPLVAVILIAILVWFVAPDPSDEETFTKEEDPNHTEHKIHIKQMEPSHPIIRSKRIIISDMPSIEYIDGLPTEL